MYYPSSENKGADQLRGYREADLRLCFRICRLLVFPRGGSYGFKIVFTTFRKCCLSRKGITNAAIDILYIDMQRKWEHVNPDRTSGMFMVSLISITDKSDSPNVSYH